jgi:hypothetical protein
MLKKVLVGILSASVLAAGGGALIHQSTSGAAAAAAPDADVVADPTATPIPNGSANGNRNGQSGANGVSAAQSNPVEQTNSLQMVGDPWTASGTISEVDDFGLTLVLDDGSEVYVELGPPSYWQAQGVELAAGDVITIDGFAGDMGYHAAVVTTADGQEIYLRSEDGQPLWSGGAANGGGQNRNGGGTGSANGLQDGTHSPQPQAQVDEWVTVEGTITAINRSQVTMELTDGESLTFQMGQPRFAESQQITLQIGDEISVLGFYEGDQFSAGEVTVLATGETIMLRDPNGRPLWAGPGGSGSGGQGGSGQNGGGNGSGGGNGNGRGSGNGNGNGNQ